MRINSEIKNRLFATGSLIVLGLVMSLMGCVDIRDYTGSWTGAVAKESSLHRGFDANVVVNPLQIFQISSSALQAELTTSDGQFLRTPLHLVPGSNADVLSTLTYDHRPLKIYLLYASTVADVPVSLLMSLFSDDRVELHLWSANDIYGVFYLHRDTE